MTLDTTTIVVFVFVTVVLGGAAALASGRAVAQAWHSFARVPLYMLPLTGAVGFLHYALFGIPAIPAGAIALAVAGGDVAALARAFAVPAMIFVILTAFGYFGWRVTRAGQMARQYGFLSARQ